jgi:hypothetical protein
MGRPRFDLPPRLSALTEIDLRALSLAAADEDTFLSVYLPAGKGRLEALRGRQRAVEKALPRRLAQAFDRTRAMIEPAIAAALLKGERGRAVFASAPLVFFSVFRLALDLQPILVLDRSPFLLPLAELREEYEDYLLLASPQGILAPARTRAGAAPAGGRGGRYWREHAATVDRSVCSHLCVPAFRLREEVGTFIAMSFGKLNKYVF